MVEVLQRYKIILVVLGIITIAMLVWFIMIRQNTDKIPSRGVFVTRPVSQIQTANISINQ